MLFFSWVQVACPRLSIDWGYAFPKPLLSPYEVRNPLFYPIKTKLLRTSCCQILAIYSIVKRDHPPRSHSLALSPTRLLVPARQGRAGEILGTRLDGYVVIMMSAYVRVCWGVLVFPSTELKHTTRPACNKAGRPLALPMSLKRVAVVSAGFSKCFTLNNVSKWFNGFDGRRKMPFLCRQ